MTHRKTTVVATALAATALAAVPAAASAKVVDCSSYSDYPNTQISSARNMTCAAATKVMKGYKGNISRRFTVGAFTCRQVSGSQYGGQWRCTAKTGGRAFRFEFKD
jgi:hypothetical protein